MSTGSYIKTMQLRWADIDANRHVLHSRYYEWGATMRMEFLVQHGLTIHWLEANNIGPIILREECIFKREIVFGDDISINVEATAAKKDYSRWSLRHQITKGRDTVAAIINVDGAWIDLAKRKMGTPNEKIIAAFDQFPRSEDFKWI